MTISKQYIVAALAVLMAFGGGLFIGVNYLAPALTQHHYTETNTVVQPTIVQGEVKTVTDTQIAYVPKETVITKYIDKATGKETTSEALKKTDLQANITKKDFNVKLNGKDIQFTKSDDEQYMFEKNKIALNQTSTITIDATVTPPTIDNTKRWSLGVGYGTAGAAVKIDFPIGQSNNVGGWVYGDKNTKTAGLELKF